MKANRFNTIQSLDINNWVFEQTRKPDYVLVEVMSAVCVILVGIAIGFYCRYWKKKEQEEREKEAEA